MNRCLCKKELDSNKKANTIDIKGSIPIHTAFSKDTDDKSNINRFYIYRTVLSEGTIRGLKEDDIGSGTWLNFDSILPYQDEFLPLKHPDCDGIILSVEELIQLCRIRVFSCNYFEDTINFLRDKLDLK